MKRKLLIAGATLCGGVVIFLLWIAFGEAPIDPVAYHPPPDPGLVGGFAVNEDLAAAELIRLQDGTGPEDVAVDADGRIYAGLSDGRIVRVLADGTQEVFVHIDGGRPLGLDFDSAGQLIVADAWKGLLSIAADGTITTLTTSESQKPFRLTDDVDVASDGKIYFSDASSKYHLTDYPLDMIEGRGNGRLLVYDPATGETSQLLDGLYFANGVAISSNRDFVLVNESARYRVTRYWLRGDRAGTSEPFIENLPGFPDGISSNGQGIFWLAIVAPRNAMIDRIHPIPFAKRLITMLPIPKPEPQHYGLVVALDEQGNVLRSLHDPSGQQVSVVTSVEQAGDQLYLGTLESPRIARIAVPDDVRPTSDDR